MYTHSQNIRLEHSTTIGNSYNISCHLGAFDARNKRIDWKYRRINETAVKEMHPRSHNKLQSLLQKSPFLSFFFELSSIKRQQMCVCVWVTHCVRPSYYEQRLQRKKQILHSNSTSSSSSVKRWTIVQLWERKEHRNAYIAYIWSVVEWKSLPTREVAHGFPGFRIKTIKRVARESDLVFSVLCVFTH